VVERAEIRLDEIAEIVGRGITPRYDPNGTCLVLNQKCIRNGRVTLDQARGHDEKSRMTPSKKLLRRGDILVNSTGVGTLGRTAPAPREAGFMTITVDSHITIVRPSEYVDASWLA
jgi:type I restriction enzyme S subunit